MSEKIYLNTEHIHPGIAENIWILRPGWNLVSLPAQPVDTIGVPLNYTAGTMGQLADVILIGINPARNTRAIRDASYFFHITFPPSPGVPLAEGSQEMGRVKKINFGGGVLCKKWKKNLINCMNLQWGLNMNLKVWSLV